MQQFHRWYAAFAAASVFALACVPQASFAQDASPSSPLVTTGSGRGWEDQHGWVRETFDAPGLLPQAPDRQPAPESGITPQDIELARTLLDEAHRPTKHEFTVDPTLLGQHAVNATVAAGTSPQASNSAGAESVSSPSAVDVGRITGVVTAGDTGLPVSNVYVAAYDASRTFVTSGTTDRSGIFSLSSYNTRTVFLRVNPSGIYPYSFAAEWFDNQSSFASATPVSATEFTTVSGLNVVLDRGAQISGTVTAGDTGAGLEKVRVRVIDADGFNIDYVDTDALGRYATGGLQSGAYRLFFDTSYGSDATKAYLPEYYAQQPLLSLATPVTVVAPNVLPGVNVALTRGASISGVVTAKDTGQPVQNAIVTLLSASSAVAIEIAETSASGGYLIDGLRSGAYKLFFRAPNLPFGGQRFANEYYNDKATFDTADVISLTTSAALAGIDAQFDAAGQITGTVTELATGEPISGVTVFADSVPYTQPGFTFGRTDSQGRYAINAQTGSYRVYFSTYNLSDQLKYCDQYFNNTPEYASATLVSVNKSQVTPNVNAALAGPGQITGTVTAADTGRPMSYTAVFAQRSGGSPGGISALTTQSGDYTLKPVCAGTYTVRFSPWIMDAFQYVEEYYNDKASSFDADPVVVPPGQSVTGIDAALDRGGVISGVVNAEDTGQPLAEAQVVLFPIRGGYTVGKTDAQGAYVFGGLRAGPYKLFFDPRYAPEPTRRYAFEYYSRTLSFADANVVNVVSGQTTALDVGLRRAATISGTVAYDNSAKPASTASMSVYATSGLYLGGSYATNGRYEFSLPPGDYKVTARPIGLDSAAYAPEYYDDKGTWASADVISVTSGAVAGNVNFTLGGGGIIAGRVVDSVTGEGVEGAYLDIYDSTSNAVLLGWTTTNASGYFTSSTALRTGGYKIRVYRPRYFAQYVGGKSTYDAADVITVTAPMTTTVNVALLSFSALPRRQHLPWMGR